jgi:hypothetical protein
MIISILWGITPVTELEVILCSGGNQFLLEERRVILGRNQQQQV